MTYEAWAFVAVSFLASIHIFAPKFSPSRFLSIGSGVAISYVFIDLLPKLAVNEMRVKQAMSFFPFLEKHVYIMALFGFLLFYTVERAQGAFKEESFYLSLGSYTLFNLLIGYAIVDENNPEVRPLLLFTFAMSLHYFTIDYSLNEAHGKEYRSYGKWILAAALYLGWLVGYTMQVSQAAVGLVSAFIGGGVIMNVTRHEISKDKPNSLGLFLISALLYAILLLGINSTNSFILDSN